jgi:hypothetical protein
MIPWVRRIAITKVETTIFLITGVLVCLRETSESTIPGG